jgi:large subunit ribosomal protein L22
MAFGVKTNERPGTRAQVKYVRSSAYKAREVLDLIRGEPVARALEILEFSERDIARTILKCLESAIANAEANDGLPADELEVAACFADEGPTLKRWRPRARGRATRIRKRTCHITVIVGRIDPERLELLRQRDASGQRAGGRAAEARRQRVLRSRQAKADKRAAEEHDHDHDHDHEDEEVDEAGESTAASSAEDEVEAGDGIEASAETETETTDETQTEAVTEDESSEDATEADVAVPEDETTEDESTDGEADGEDS